MTISGINPSAENTGLKLFSKLTCFATLFLIFVGGMVKSTDSGLAVPDWPLSYGMLFPPMVGGVFYEHGHRMVAALVGFFTLILAVWIGTKELRPWVRHLAYWALGLVIFQGLLGGITVLFFLPDPISIAHGVLAQTFFLLTILIAYTQSQERKEREGLNTYEYAGFLKILCYFCIAIYIQLILGAIMRHTESGLAIPDFPKTGGYWLPIFNDTMLFRINDWRFENNFNPVTMMQVFIHLIHRLWALVIIALLIPLNIIGLKCHSHDLKIMQTIYWIDSLLILQISLGISTIYSVKEPVITSLHVVTGAALLGLAFLLFLRTAPLDFATTQEKIFT